jgi:hypothetical protein
MSYASFSKLMEILQPWLQTNAKQSSNASKGKQPIVPEIIMHCTLCYIAGGSYHDICTNAGMSIMTFYRCVCHGIDAINSSSVLRLIFPITVDELVKAAAKFEQPSSDGTLNGCVGALDGWHCLIHVPLASEVKKVQSYFSDHYQCNGLNVQATPMVANNFSTK